MDNHNRSMMVVKCNYENNLKNFKHSTGAIKQWYSVASKKIKNIIRCCKKKKKKKKINHKSHISTFLGLKLDLTAPNNIHMHYKLRR